MANWYFLFFPSFPPLLAAGLFVVQSLNSISKQNEIGSENERENEKKGEKREKKARMKHGDGERLGKRQRLG